MKIFNKAIIVPNFKLEISKGERVPLHLILYLHRQSHLLLEETKGNLNKAIIDRSKNQSSSLAFNLIAQSNNYQKTSEKPHKINSIQIQTGKQYSR